MYNLAELYEDQGQYVKALAWAWVALHLARNYDEERAARDLRTRLARLDAISNDTVDQAEALANSLLQDIP